MDRKITSIIKAEKNISILLNGLWGILDVTGKEIIPIKYENMGYLREGLYSAKLNGKWGYIDESGQIIIAFQYDEIVSDFANGKAQVKVNNETFFINKKGERMASNQ